VYPGRRLGLDCVPFHCKKHVLFAKSAEQRTSVRQRNNNTQVRCVGGRFSGCFEQFLVRKHAGKKMPKQYFQKKKVKIEKKPDNF